MAYRSNLLADLVVGLLCLLVACQSEVKGEDEIQALCTIEAGSGVGNVYGTVKMYQKSGSHIQFDVSLKGFNRSATVTQHGFHIHEFGSVGRKCNDSGAHYNPENKTHGAPGDTERHVGDLGNVEVDTNGEVNVTLTDRIITLFGVTTVLDRSFVVHEKVDDLGKGNFSDSKTTGHAGARFGCCIIKKTTVSAGNRWSEVQSTVVAMLFLASLISIY